MNSLTYADKPQWIEQIRETEAAFCTAAESNGLKSAFLEFAADTAVLKRGERLIEGKSAISQFFDDTFGSDDSDSRVSLQWSPSFIDVSDDGTLGYTYGSYTFTRTDVTGEMSHSTGIFHTVWKRQQDGSWKYVWD